MMQKKIGIFRMTDRSLIDQISLDDDVSAQLHGLLHGTEQRTLEIIETDQQIKITGWEPRGFQVAMLPVYLQLLLLRPPLCLLQTSLGYIYCRHRVTELRQIDRVTPLAAGNVERGSVRQLPSIAPH